MSELKLYELAEAVRRIEDLCDTPEEMSLYLDSVKMELKTKAENIIKFRQYLTTRAEAIGLEIKRLSDLQKSVLKRADNLEGYISHTMINNGIDKIETDIATISFRKSEAVDILDESMIPEEYKIIKTTKSVDKTEIKKAIKSGLYVTGAELVVRKNLQIH
jgi:hypothetical protein